MDFQLMKKMSQQERGGRGEEIWVGGCKLSPYDAATTTYVVVALNIVGIHTCPS